MYFLADTLSVGTITFLVLAIALALLFEMVNGFHDTANAVATVIYTNTLQPSIAVIWSGCWNLIGVLCSSGIVAFTILALLPPNLVLHVGSASSFAMVFAILISAILWNLGTWYLGLPASSSHTLIGSIIGVGLANSVVSAGHSTVNWATAQEVLPSLLISPIVGFICAGGLLLTARYLFNRRHSYVALASGQKPPIWIRALLISTCTGVSFAHGSNDGQKGMGLILLILIGILPGEYALNMKSNASAIANLRSTALVVQATEPKLSGDTIASARQRLTDFVQSRNTANTGSLSAIGVVSGEIARQLVGLTTFDNLATDQRQVLRSDIYLMSQSVSQLNQKASAPSGLLSHYRANLNHATQYIPTWVKVAVAISLGCGTMIGWKRIVKTVGEKLGKEHLSYAQGVSAEIVAMAAVAIADRWGLPVSTTHVLFSGIAGTMVANRSGVQMATVRNVLLAWILTLPISILLGAALFAAGLFIVFNHLIFMTTSAVAGLALFYGIFQLYREFIADMRYRRIRYSLEMAFRQPSNRSR
jgi:inorganic phosphate transporter, PiT family